MTDATLPPHQRAVALELGRTLGSRSEFRFDVYPAWTPTPYTATFELQPPREGVRVVATLQGQQDDVFLTPTEGDGEAIGRILVSVEELARDHRFAIGHTVPIDAEPLRERGWVAAIIMPLGAFFEGLEELTIGGRHVRCFWVLFIDQEEYDLRRSADAAAFIERVGQRSLVKW